MSFLGVLGNIASGVLGAIPGIGDVASGILGGLGGIGQAAQQQENIKFQREMMQQNQAWQSEENALNRQFQADQWQKQFDLTNAYNDPRQQALRLLGAGMNPAGTMEGAGASAASGNAIAHSGLSGAAGLTPSPDYSGVLTTGYQSMNLVSQTIKNLMEARKSSAEGSKVADLLDSQIAKNLGEGANQQAQAAQTEFNLQLDKIFGVKLREESIAKLVSEVKQIYADIELKGSEVSLNEVKEFEQKALALLHEAERNLSDENVRQLKELLNFKKSALQASASRDIAEAGKLSAETITENALRDYRVAIEKAESLIKGNETLISERTWKDTVEAVREAAKAAGLENDKRIKDLIKAGFEVNHMVSSEVRNWIKTIQGFIPTAPVAP